MDELNLSRIALSNAFLTFFKAQSFHWNVVGKEFLQLHEFFGEIYQDSFEAVDKFAEEIRAMGQFAPRTIQEMLTYGYLPDSVNALTAEGMLNELLNSNMQSLEVLSKLFDRLSELKNQGFANFVADRMDTLNKQNWMIKSLIGV